MFNALKRKRFEDSDDDNDDDIDVIDVFDKKKNVRKNNKVIIKQSLYNIKKDVSSIKETKSHKLDDSDVDIIDSKSNSPITTNSNSNNIENEAEEEVQRLLKSFITETIDITKADTITTNTSSSSSSSNQNSKRAEEIDKLLKEIDKKKKVIFFIIIIINTYI